MEPTNQIDINGWHLNTAYVVNFDLIPAEVRVEFGGETIASSSKTRVMYELGHAPMYYFPRSGVELSLLELSDHSSYCPYKGKLPTGLYAPQLEVNRMLFGVTRIHMRRLLELVTTWVFIGV